MFFLTLNIFDFKYFIYSFKLLLFTCVCFCNWCTNKEKKIQFLQNILNHYQTYAFYNDLILNRFSNL